jgi:hypothetical protein
MSVQGSTTEHQVNVTIVVNGQDKTVSSRELSFEQLVNLAFDNNPPKGPDVLITVTYRRGEGHKPQGSLVAGETVKVKEGMIFNVTATNKS